jgi:RNA polymerase sigma factor (sigma-70 family)
MTGEQTLEQQLWNLYPWLLAVARRLAGWTDAEDRVQQTYLHVLQHRRNHPDQPLEHVAGLAYVILRRICAREGQAAHRRRTAPLDFDPPSADESDPSTKALWRDLVGRLAALLSRLPEPDGSIIRMRMAQLPYKMIARAVGLTPVHCRVVCHRVLQQLRTRLA